MSDEKKKGKKERRGGAVGQSDTDPDEVQKIEAEKKKVRSGKEQKEKK